MLRNRFLTIKFIFIGFVLSLNLVYSQTNESDPLDELWNNNQETGNSENSQGSQNPFKDFTTETKKTQFKLPDNPSISLRLLDKTIARYFDVTIPVGHNLDFGAINIEVKSCIKKPPDEFPETAGLILIKKRLQKDVNKKFFPTSKNRFKNDDKIKDENHPFKDIPRSYNIALNEKTNKKNKNDYFFAGWMFASNPSLNSLENLIYDVWVIDCNVILYSN